MSISNAPTRCRLCNAPFPIPENVTPEMGGAPFCNRPGHWQAAGYTIVVEGTTAALKHQAQPPQPRAPDAGRVNGSRPVSTGQPTARGRENGRPRPGS